MPPSTAPELRRSGPFEHTVDARWLMAYAAGLGDTLPCYLDTEADTPVIAHPLFTVCLEWPAILAVQGRTAHTLQNPGGRGAGVHATHDLHIHRPITAGDVLTTRAEAIGLEQRKPGAYSTMKLDTVDARGAPVSTTWQGSLNLGEAVDGDPIPCETPPWPTRREPVREPATVVPIHIPANAAHVYTECARIWNPIHTDVAVAHRAGLPDIILHGTATLALAVSQLVRVAGDNEPSRVRRVCGLFGGMVFMPGTIELVITGRERQDDGEVVFFEVINQQGRPAVRDGAVCFG